MFHSSARRSGLFILLALLFASIACNLPGMKTNISNQNDLVTAETAVGTQNDEADQNRTPAGERVAYTITEGQLNAIVQQAIQNDPDQRIENLQLHLLPGEVALSGIVNQESLSLPLQLTLALTPDGQGGLNYEVSSANIGPLPLPQSMQVQIETMLNQNLDAPVRQMTDNIFIEEISIGEGVLNVVGHTQ